MEKTKKVMRRGRAISVLYEYDGKIYRHTFSDPPDITLRDGEVVIKGGFKVSRERGIH